MSCPILWTSAFEQGSPPPRKLLKETADSSFLVSRLTVPDVRDKDLSSGSVSWVGSARPLLGVFLLGPRGPSACSRRNGTAPPGLASQACLPTCELCCQALGIKAQHLRVPYGGGKRRATRSAAMKTFSGRFYQPHLELLVFS